MAARKKRDYALPPELTNSHIVTLVHKTFIIRYFQLTTLMAGGIVVAI
jgi:hypothetical protein